LQATSLVKGMNEQGKPPFNVELFGGSPDDNNAFFFYDGAMSVLKPMIDKGDIKIVSGQMGMDKVGTLRWDGAVAQARMDNLLSANYTKAKVNGVLSPYDGLSRGIISSLKGVGYGSATQAMPIVSGQDAELASVKGMMVGEQYSTVFKDTRVLAKLTAAMVDAAMSGKDVPVNDTKTYNNGVKVVPSNLLVPVSLDKAGIAYFMSIFTATGAFALPLGYKIFAVFMMPSISFCWYCMMTFLVSSQMVRRCFDKASAWLDRIAGGLMLAFGFKLLVQQ